MKTHDSYETTDISCARCGKCCHSVFLPFTDENIERWKREGKEKLANAVEHARVMWAGDIMIFTEDGMPLFTCPFLRWEGEFHTCTIYEDRPRVCREFRPGSSELCPQFKKTVSSE